MMFMEEASMDGGVIWDAKAVAVVDEAISNGVGAVAVLDIFEHRILGVGGDKGGLQGGIQGDGGDDVDAMVGAATKGVRNDDVFPGRYSMVKSKRDMNSIHLAWRRVSVGWVCK